MQGLRMGIVGAGRLGAFHAAKAVARDDVELVGIYDVNHENARTVAERVQSWTFDSPKSLADSVQAAVIAVPSVHHAEIARLFLDKGVSLLIEKPMTTTASEAKSLIALAEKNKAKILVGHTEQYNPAWEAGRQFLASGIPCLIDARRTSGYTFRSTDIGVVLDLMIHDLELILSAIPDEITQVDAFSFSTMGGYEDFAQARLTFANGTTANLTASRVEQEAVRKMSMTSPRQSQIIDFAARSITCRQVSDEVRLGEFAPYRISAETIAKIQPTFMQTGFPTSTESFPTVDALTLEMADFVGM
ncbi:MAG: Gfo/Idh/MocA family oxidoreductase, partial [Planctomycetaceae bacterium]|nr:Gfo/Idh/MocA family oxidoreductase [Planctomycetaceae bacterium]